MKKLNLTVARVNVFEKEIEIDNQTVVAKQIMLTTKEQFEGYSKDDATGAFVPSPDCNSLSFSALQLKDELADVDEMLAIYMSMMSFTQLTVDEIRAKLSVLLIGTKLDVVQTMHKAGEEYTRNDGTTDTYSRDCATYTIAGGKLSDLAVRKLDAALGL